MNGPILASAGRKLTLVLPACNEEAGVRAAVVEADEALAGMFDEYEILVVDDGSRDATAAIVEQEAARRPRVHLLRHDKNRGYGAALRTGFEAARFDLVAFTDADCQFYLQDLERLVPLTEYAAIAAGWREDRKDSWLRCFVSRGYNLLTRSLLGTCVRDCDCALKIFRREALDDVLPQTNGFFVNTEMLCRARQLGYLVAEAGVRHRPRLRGKSTVSLRDVPRTLAALLPFWWSSVLFSGGRDTPAPTGPRRPLLPALLLLMACACLLFFTQLRAPLLEPQEPRYAEIPRQMLAQGRFIVPVLRGEPYLDKPPLLYWCVMAAYAVFGVHDWAARLVPAFAGVLSVLLTYLWGRRVVGERAGLVGALVLCLSARFVYLERMLTMDCLLCLCITAALGAAHAALIGGRLRLGWWLLSAASCALGVLTKGPVACVLVMAPTAACMLLDSRAARPTLRWWALYVAVVILIAAPWYVAISVVQPDFAVSFFWRHNVVRFLEPFDHAEPFWFHLPPLLLGMLPWTLALPGFLRFLSRRSVRSAARRPAALGFFLLAGAWSVVFFSASGCKRPVYILPALPPLALALGCYLNVLIPDRSRRVGWSRLLWHGSRLAFDAALLILALGCGIAVAAGLGHLVKPPTACLLAGGAAVGIGLLCAFRRRASWPVCAAAVFAVLFAGVMVLQPGYNRQYTLRNCLRDVPRTPGLPVICYPQMWDAVSFYLPAADVRAYGVGQREEMLAALRARPGTLLLAKSGPLLDDLLRDLPGPVEVVRHGRRGAVTAAWVRTRRGPADNLFAAK